MARECKFVQREPQKIFPLEFLCALFLTVFTGKNTYQNNAEKIGLLINDTVSKQAVHQRTNENVVEWLKLILLSSLKKTSRDTKSVNVQTNVFDKFNRVLITDSTYISLPPFLAKFFGGCINQSKKETATCKIQATIDILKECYCNFEITRYNKNDQEASHDILNIAQSNDLIIRDLGYFSLAVFKKIIMEKIFFLSRLRANVSIYLIKQKEKFNLLDYLKKNIDLEYIDIDVILGQKHKVPVRLVAQRLPEEVAAERRRKEKNHHDRRLNPSEEKLELLGWNIYITNVLETTWDAKTVCAVYHIRWRIEIIFKSWKSFFKISEVPKANKERVEMHIYMHLLVITLYHSYNYVNMLEKYYQNKSQKHLSLLKFSNYLKEQSWAIIIFFGDEQGLKTFEKQAAYWCNYEKRKKRKSYPQKLLALG